MKVKVKIEGVDKLKRTLERLGAKAPEKLAPLLYQEGETIMREAKELTPVDTGALRSTGHVQLPVLTEKGASVTLGFGGPAGATFTNKATGRVVKRGERIGYAVWVHEDMTAFHPVGQAKFLEEPFKKHAKAMPSRLAAKLMKGFRDEAGGRKGGA